VLIFLLLNLAAHRFFQLLLLDASESTPSMPGNEASASDSDGLTESFRLLVGLVGRGEKVPWLQGPSWACSLKSSTAGRRAVASVGRLLGPAWRWVGGCLSGEAGPALCSSELDDDAV
jgi:hypothetical protein